MIRIGLILSMVVNGILIAFVIGLMPFLLYLSVLIHVASVWYMRLLLTEMSQYNRDMNELLLTCVSLQRHIESVHEMEMFYGEPVLQDMMEHTLQVNEEIQFYVEKYSLEDPIEQEEEIDETENSKEEETR